MASVDVAIPCYQYGRFLRNCVESVLRQDGVRVRALIIDNASTDDTLEIARALSAVDARVEVVARKENLGHLASFNEGIDRAQADYFMVLCADDMLVPGALARACALMESNPSVVLTFGREMEIGPEDPPPAVEQPQCAPQWRIFQGPQLIDCLCRSGRPDASRFMIPGTTAVVRTAAQRRAGHYRKALPHSADLEMWLRLACCGDAAKTDFVQGIRRVHPLNRSSTLADVHAWDELWEDAFESFFRNEGRTVAAGAQLRRKARRALAERAYWGSLANLLRGNPRLGANLFRFAVTRCPGMLIVPPVGYVFRRFRRFGHSTGVAGTSRWQPTPFLNRGKYG